MPARTIGRTAVAAILLIACWPAAAQATFPGQNGKIAVFAVSAAGQGVHLLNADGTGSQTGRTRHGRPTAAASPTSAGPCPTR